MLGTWKQLPRYWLTWLRSALVGCWMGVTPGGPTAASFMSYSLARRFSKNRDGFGKGELEGVIAPETADHSAGTSALLPMLTLGIPGSATAAVMLGGLMIWGLHPGPTLFTEQHDFVWSLIASMYLGNVVSLIVVLATVPLFAAILRIPFCIIAPIIFTVCVIGAYSVHNSLFDVWLMLGFASSAMPSRSSAIPSPRWCWRRCWVTRPRTPSASRCCSPTASWASSGPTRWWAV